MTDEELLSLVSSEKRASVGFELDDVLLKEREKALEYTKGEMKDVPALPGRSRSVSTDVSDAIETVLPDIIEIFTGGEDVVAFRPTGEEDEDGAQQETDFIKHVFFEENPGFLILYTLFKDALQVKTGVATWWWDEYEYEEESVQVDAPGLEQLQAIAEPSGFEIIGVEADGDQFKVTVQRVVGGGCAKVRAVPPEDFTVARDTVELSKATYCAMRSRPRAQELIADGYDKEKVDGLPAWSMPNEEMDIARDTAGESEIGSSALQPLRQVEIVQHFIRVMEEGKLVIYRVVTGGNETVLLEKDKVERIQFSAITPYITTHRFYGRSLADLLIEIQKIKTALLRMMLDSGYFALNQRVEIAADKANEFTIGDLLRNEPGVPVRVKSSGAITPISAGSPNFDLQAALEYVSTMAEQRTGVLRNGQGLNPDSLHETKGGMMQMAAMGQKRVRLIARIFAETGIKDMFLGIHALIREHGSKSAKARLRNKWVEVDPTSWGSRNDMSIEIGVGAGGMDFEMQKSERLGNVLERLIQGGGAAMVPPDKLYNAASDSIRAIGYKDPERYLADPATQAKEPPKPDPEVEQAKAEFDLKVQEIRMKDQLERERMQAEFDLRREEMAAEYELKSEANRMNAIAKASQPQTNMRNVQTGGAVG